jgi:hypothetical protein
MGDKQEDKWNASAERLYYKLYLNYVGFKQTRDTYELISYTNKVYAIVLGRNKQCPIG